MSLSKDESAAASYCRFLSASGAREGLGGEASEAEAAAPMFARILHAMFASPRHMTIIWVRKKTCYIDPRPISHQKKLQGVIARRAELRTTRPTRRRRNLWRGVRWGLLRRGERALWRMNTTLITGNNMYFLNSYLLSLSLSLWMT